MIGDMRVEIQNRKGESIQTLPGNAKQKLLVELKVLFYDFFMTQNENGDIKRRKYESLLSFKVTADIQILQGNAKQKLLIELKVL